LRLVDQIRQLRGRRFHLRRRSLHGDGLGDLADGEREIDHAFAADRQLHALLDRRAKSLQLRFHVV